MPERPPEKLREIVSGIESDSRLNYGVNAMLTRDSEFDSKWTAKLAGIAMSDPARARFDRQIDQWWKETTMPSKVAEVIVGGGLHAAIYAAVRVREGFPKPLVLEGRERAGGSFAMTKTPTFWLNSRNRPGAAGIPGRQEALNFLPGAVIQPSMLGSGEYQDNAALAFAIRATLATYARVVTSAEVQEYDQHGVTVTHNDSTKRVKAARVILATGLGTPQMPPQHDGNRIVTYEEFMSSLDGDFPLRGLENVAVVGAGDGGKTVIEALIGQGPRGNMTVADLDYVDRIEWFGLDEQSKTREGFEQCNRSRYKGIARALPKGSSGRSGERRRIYPRSTRPTSIGIGYDGAYVDGARFDKVIWATGFDPAPVEGDGGIVYRVMGRGVARMLESGVFQVGPAAALPQESEPALEKAQAVPENTVALFRYADRTAALAMSLPNLEIPDPPAKPQESGRVSIVDSMMTVRGEIVPGSYGAEKTYRP